MPVYGVNTGYGSLARVRIDGDQIRALSWNLIRSHAAGVGPPVPADAVRAMMLLRANALARGASGCRPELVDTLCAMLAAGVIPEVPSRGSCGSSGDLAPLAHLGLVVFCGDDGDGIAWYDGERLSGREAMRRAGIEPLVPGPKEGLAMTNGAQLSCGLAALMLVDAEHLVLAAEVAAAASWEALQGVTRALHPDVHALRPYPGALAVAGDLRRLLDGSGLVDSVPGKVQDAYSLRCTPQVLGAVRDALTYAGRQVSIELNAVTDNPLILVDADDPNKAFSAGMFHGEPVGFAADHAKLALIELSALAERRLYRLTNGALSSRLPPLLATAEAGFGRMMPQATAAALVAANRQMAVPSSADTLPTCEDQEDHVAMSTTAARRAADVLANSQQVIAIELLCAATGLWCRLDERPGVRLGQGTRAALDAVEEALGGRGSGVPSDDIAAVHAIVVDGTLVDRVQQATGPLALVHDEHPLETFHG
jgi:histidine ammonia-lyase